MALALALALSLLAAPASGDSAATLGAARQLGIEGLSLFKEARFAEALDKFVAADSLVPAHTLGLGAARCLARLGRLVEASEKYLEVQRRPLEGGALPAQRQALKDAILERMALLPRIPQLVLHLRGERLAEVELKLDGRLFPRALLDQKAPIDPGPHKLVLERGSAVVHRVIQVDESKTQEVTLSAPALPAVAAPAPEGPASLEIGGWLGVSVGLAGLVTFGVAGSVALTQQGSLASRCPGGACPPDQWGAVDAYDAARVASVVGIAAAGVGLAVGVPMLVVASRRASSQAPPGSADSKGATLHLGPQGVSLTGRF